MIDITKFYDPDNGRDYCTRPFAMNGMTYATNGDIFVCIPGDNGADPLTGFMSLGVGCEAIVNEIKNALASGDAIPLDVKLPDKMICGPCDGTGKKTWMRCDDCDGDGKVRFYRGNHTYICDCLECGGEGEIPISGVGDTCKYCDGSGKAFGNVDQIVEILGLNISAKYIETIMEPGTEVCSIKDKYMLCFRNGNSVGAIMGIKM